ncbi:mitochondrial assembly of ribosomal large subunit protein 1 [Silurus meridionalis]|nr:mitochondrial assembly of ribosomal large subunit protein 1 [Silurus meridionalis]
MSVREAMSSLQMTSSVDKLHTLPVEHLDYTYIQKCGDLKYLEKILHVLRSGKEGMYPHLIEFCEKRIESLDPRHRILRKDMCPATSASFSTEEWSNITEDLQRVPAGNEHRFDVDKECAKIEEGVNNNDAPAVINSAHADIKQHIDTSDAKTGVDKPAHWDKKGQTDRETKRQMEIKTDEETERKNDGVRHGVDAATARSEGNELYRIGQYGAAAEKYTHGITTLTQSGVYTEEDMFVLYCNRAACFLKMGQCSECVSDCSRALQLKPFGVKALLRRAMAFEALEQFRLAFVDYRTVQQIHNTYCVQQHVNSNSDGSDAELTARDSYTHNHRQQQQHGGAVFNLDVLVSLLREENAADICAIRVSDELKYTDYFIIVSGSSTRHLKAMAEYAIKVYKFLRRDCDPHTHIEGQDSDDWMCIDFGSMVVHFMLPETREKFQLETLWTLRSYEQLTNNTLPHTLPPDFILTHAQTHTHTHTVTDTITH